jgi:hypothetical protein
MSFIIGFLTGIFFTILVIALTIIYQFAKTAEEAHRDGYENPYL